MEELRGVEAPKPVDAKGGEHDASQGVDEAHADGKLKQCCH